jgi:hypothetical protein
MFIQHLATTTHNVVKAERKPRRNIQYRDVSSAVAKTDNLEFLVDVVPKTMTYGQFRKRQEGREREKEKDKKKGEEGKGGAGKDGEEGKVNGQIQTKITTTMTNAGVGAKDGEDTESEIDISEGGVALPVEPSTSASTSPPAQNGHAPAQADKPATTPEVMDIDNDDAPPRDSKDDTEDPDEPDPAAMQIEMEMRGPRTNGNGNGNETSPVVQRHTGGFTAINGAK